MTFKDVIFKNFRGDLSKYISFFLSGVFCVAMFFTYSTLALLDEITNAVESYPMQLLMIVSCFIVFIFSIFFISYSEANFIRNKKKELATYMMLGMNEKDGMVLLAVETGVIAAASIVVGIITGLVFSRLFQVIALKIIDIDKINYRFSAVNFIATAVAFLLIYSVCTLVSIIKLKKQDITSIIKENRKKEKRQSGTKNFVWFVVGIVLLLFSIIFVIYAAPDNDINYKLWVALCFVISGYLGTYFIIVNGISWILEHKRKKADYYKNMLSVSGMEYKFGQNTRIIIILAMLASMIVLLVGSPIALLSISTGIAEESNADVEYMVTKDLTKEDDVLEDDIEGIIGSDNIKSERITKISYTFDEELKVHPVMAASVYNEKYNAEIAVEPGKVAVINITWVPGTNGYTVGEKLQLESAEYSISRITKGDFFCVNLFTGGSVYVINDKDFEEISGSIPYADVHEIALNEKWKDSGRLNDKLTAFLAEGGLFNSRLKQYIMLKHGYGMFLFVSCSMCIMFFISTGFVLYFKQYNDIDEDKKRYVQLYKMGISDKEVKKSIKKKMSVVYFVPLIGGIMGILIMYYLSNLFGGRDIVRVFMSKSYIGFVLYSVSQLIFYLMLKSKYIKDVIS